MVSLSAVTITCAPRGHGSVARGQRGARQRVRRRSWTREAEDLLRQEFGADSVPILVANGTGANLIAPVLPASLGRGGLLGRRAHQRRRGGAPERILGSKLIGLPTRTGASCPSSWPRPANASVMSTPCNLQVSLTQSTEYGTVYTAEQAGTFGVRKPVGWG